PSCSVASRLDPGPRGDDPIATPYGSSTVQARECRAPGGGRRCARSRRAARPGGGRHPRRGGGHRAPPTPPTLGPSPGALVLEPGLPVGGRTEGRGRRTGRALPGVRRTPPAAARPLGAAAVPGLPRRPPPGPARPPRRACRPEPPARGGNNAPAGARGAPVNGGVAAFPAGAPGRE